jgi:oligopeptide/dipeptide ABC transporter ATP-binding protein
MGPAPLLQVEDLRTHFALRDGTLKAVDGVSFAAMPGRTLCLVGESGSGKSVTALSVMRLIDPPGRIVGGRILFKGRNLMQLSETEMEEVRGNRIGMVFQNPMTSLDPSFRIGDQIPDAAQRYRDYPHQFSGGMRQRVLIATAIACRPDVLIADEPTTALDVTIQAQILKLLRELQRRMNSSLLLITHDLGVVAAMADEVMVMYAGRVVEHADVDTIFHAPRHPYTIGLLQSLIRLEDSRQSSLWPIPGAPPSPIDLPSGCSFRPRCRRAFERCDIEVPSLVRLSDDHCVACHRALDTA